tara:strand:+ start:4841 stop:5359 length:519 start_codon:yes stop_codon:yes gene_type:complete
MQVVVNSAYRLSNQWQVAVEYFRHWYFGADALMMIALWAVLAYFDYSDLNGSYDASFPIRQVAFFLFFVVLPPFVISAAIASLFAIGTKPGQRTVEIIFDDLGISLKAHSGSCQTIVWNEIKRLIELDRAIVMRTRAILSVPKEDFTAEDLIRVRQLANEKLGERAKMKTSL